MDDAHPQSPPLVARDRPLAELARLAPGRVGGARRSCAGDVSIPWFDGSVAAGFPSPADDYLERSLNLNDFLIQHPDTSFFVRVAGDAMAGAGIFDGDLLIVDRLLPPRHNDVVVAVAGDEFLVRRLHLSPGQVCLRAAQPGYADLQAEAGVEIWGVVSSVVRSLR
ncbi:DNA polymerase V [Chromobacterium alkanivorans]|uniref:LexA family protein n=1 Tax=Chromobacterium alkanivorans TaxID=1071719 RepID=UPI002168C2A5|nr:DNA polymerase V [Chromobacterium alkanivorans]MCS3818223.1 DNA polymerase V [Chromobacterium alkanivorans]MCS3874578.1 DNA polymerase V [Chromobacterium alkanivorans]